MDPWCRDYYTKKNRKAHVGVAPCVTACAGLPRDLERKRELLGCLVELNERKPAALVVAQRAHVFRVTTVFPLHGVVIHPAFHSPFMNDVLLTIVAKQRCDGVDHEFDEPIIHHNGKCGRGHCRGHVYLSFPSHVCDSVCPYPLKTRRQYGTHATTAQATVLYTARVEQEVRLKRYRRHAGVSARPQAPSQYGMRHPSL